MCVINVERHLVRQVISQHTNAPIQVRSPIRVNVGRHLVGQVISQDINSFIIKVRSPQCGKALSRTSYLGKHKLNHTGETPYVCDQCGKAFKRDDNLTIYSQAHNYVTGSVEMRQSRADHENGDI